jgi:hypothetical protein
MARFIALIYNWWNLFVRLAEPDKHLEAVTSRPLLLSAIAERSRHARQTTLRVASSHAKAGWAASVLSGIANFLHELTHTAEQLTADQCWRRILSHAARSWLGGRQLRAPPRLTAPV